MICPYQQTLAHFGPRTQLLKLREECLELAEAITHMELSAEAGTDCIEALAHVYDESGDVLNVLRSLMSETEAIETCARTKMLRTQIRMRAGYYDQEGAA